MKSWVTSFTKRCVVCGKEYETGELGLDIRMEESFERRTCTGFGVCAEHRIDGTYIVECDYSKSDWDGNKLISPYLTGRVVAITKDAAKKLFDIPKATDFLVIDDVSELWEAQNEH